MTLLFPLFFFSIDMGGGPKKALDLPTVGRGDNARSKRITQKGKRENNYTRERVHKQGVNIMHEPSVVTKQQYRQNNYGSGSNSSTHRTFKRLDVQYADSSHVRDLQFALAGRSSFSSSLLYA
jgi:hypothetical protein